MCAFHCCVQMLTQSCPQCWVSQGGRRYNRILQLQQHVASLEEAAKQQQAAWEAARTSYTELQGKYSQLGKDFVRLRTSHLQVVKDANDAEVRR